MRRQAQNDWFFSRRNLTLTTHAGGYAYALDLERFTTSAQVLDMVAQIAGKKWATDSVLSSLVRELNRLLHLQGNYCGSGVERGPVDVSVILRSGS